MAVIQLNEAKSVSCKFITHVDGEGKEKYMTRAIAKFKTDADLEDINETATAISSLCAYNVKAVILTERSELEED